MKKLIIILCVLFTSLSYSQLSFKEKRQLEDELLKRINDLRISKKIPTLAKDTILYKAAELHAIYITKNRRLSHKQHTVELRNPKDRVFKFSDDFELVGENILYSKPVTLPLSEAKIKKIAFDMFRSWKNSPGHYNNMILFSYNLSGFGFDYDIKSRRIYAVHVLGKKGIKIPNQLSTNNFDIVFSEDSDTSCEMMLERYSNILINMGNSLRIVGDEIVFKYHNNKYLREIFTDSKDGLAVDLVVRDQFTCEEMNLDMSPVHDGVLLKPIYRDELFNNNKAKSDYRFIVSLGKIPKHLLGKNISPSLVIIKKKKFCEYVIPVDIDSDSYDLLEIAPSLTVPEVVLPKEGINRVVEVVFDFDTGKVTPIKNPKITFDSSDIIAVDIQSFTSVEGNYDLNHRLHNDRANYIQNYLLKQASSDVLVTKEAKENWELCEYQLELLGKENLMYKPKGEIREYIKNHLSNWEEFLKKQRRSKALVYLKGTWDNNTNNEIQYSLLTAIVDKNIPLINKCLAILYNNDEHASFLSNEIIFSKLLNYEELVENLSAIMLKNYVEYNNDDIVYYIRNWLKKPEVLSTGAQKNLLNLYAITTQWLLRSWDTDSKTLAKVMDPAKVDRLLEKYKGQTKFHPLLLNYHIATIKYYGQINKSSRISISFNFISDYYKSKVSDIDDEVKLCLFFNSWSMYRYTTELLLSRMDSKSFNEAAAFLLAQNISSNYLDKRELVAKIHTKAFNFNKKRWCNWINNDFQLLRNDTISSLYCETCQN